MMRWGYENSWEIPKKNLVIYSIKHIWKFDRNFKKFEVAPREPVSPNT